MTAPRPAVSICVPVYNKARLLPRLLASIERQQVPGIEVVAVDNASTDDSAAVLESWRDRLDLRVHRLPATISAPENWLLALSLGTGEHLKLQLADDVIPDGALARLLAVLRERPDVGFVFGRTRLLDDEGAFIADGSTFRFWESVNRDRARMGTAVTLSEKGRFLRSLPPRDGQFGDANAIVFRAELLPVLREGIDSVTSSFCAHPELEIFLRLFAASTPCFVDTDASYYSYDNDNFFVRFRDLHFRRRSIDIPSLNVLFLSTLDPSLRPLMRAAGRGYVLRVFGWQLRLAAKRVTRDTRARALWIRLHVQWVTLRKWRQRVLG
jgi:glycosyltransferase involved in cell wall biosynthesis